MIYCSKCRRVVDSETYNFWQGTAWCAHCCTVVSGSWCKVPAWVLATVCLLAIRINTLA